MCSREIEVVRSVAGMKRPFEVVEHAPPEHEQHTEATGSGAPAAVTVVDDGSDGGDDDADLGLDVCHKQRLARALGVDLCCAPVETLAYAVLRKHDRGIPIQKNDLLDVWHAIPKKYKLKETGNIKARMFLVGANPRQVDASQIARIVSPIALSSLTDTLVKWHPALATHVLASAPTASKHPTVIPEI